MPQANAVSDKLLDLRKCNYSGKNLSGKTLAGALLSETDMTNTNLTEAVLTKVGRGAGAARQLQQGVGRSCSRGWVAAGGWHWPCERNGRWRVWVQRAAPCMGPCGKGSSSSCGSVAGCSVCGARAA